MWARVDDRRPFTAALIGLIVLAWLVLLAWGQSPYGRFLGHEQLGDVKLSLSGGTALLALAFVGGWTLMIFAMMLPTSLPLITMFRTMTRRRHDRRLLAALLVPRDVGGWAPFGVPAPARRLGL